MGWEVRFGYCYFKKKLGGLALWQYEAWLGGGLGEGHCTLNLSINAIFPILILRTAEVPENYTKPPRGPKKRTSAPVLTQKHSDNA